MCPRSKVRHERRNRGRRSAGAGQGRRRHRVRRAAGHRRVPRPQRHDAVAAAGDLSRLQGRLRPELRPDRPGDPVLPADRLDPAAGGRLCGRQAPDPHGPARRRPVLPGRPCRAVDRPQLRRDPDRREPAGRRLLGVPSGMLAGGADGGRAAAGPGPGPVPGGRQCRRGARPPGRRPGGGEVRAEEPGLLRPAGPVDRRHPVERRPVVPR